MNGKSIPNNDQAAASVTHERENALSSLWGRSRNKFFGDATKSGESPL